MYVKEAVVARLREICDERCIKINELANRAGLTPSTVYSIFDVRRMHISIITLKKLCDGLDMKLKEFFDSPIFDNLEQELI